MWDLRLFDAGRAITAYQSVLDVDPSNVTALQALEGLYEKTNQSEKYLEILEAQLDVSPSEGEKISLYERMAAAWEERFGKLDRAAEALEKIVAIDSRNYSAYRELARLYQQAAKWEALVETYRNHSASTTDVQTRVDLYVAMGVVYETNLGDIDRAVEAYTDVLQLDADEQRALEALSRLYEKISEWYRAIEVMASLTQLTEDMPQAGRPVPRGWAASSTRSSATRSQSEANLPPRPGDRPGPRAGDGGPDAAVLGSR